ncbi:hypothetical protein V6N13_110712 [Hibiscus sabdariffa]|uniref:Uncharacterized protein n=1 Tax=Hibiscus sabdariffa TaxID=183260 RepID=A0ABR2TIT1_9ROSI
MPNLDFPHRSELNPAHSSSDRRRWSARRSFTGYLGFFTVLGSGDRCDHSSAQPSDMPRLVNRLLLVLDGTFGRPSNSSYNF